jgi:hypothetical protein
MFIELAAERLVEDFMKVLLIPRIAHTKPPTFRVRTR